MADPATWRLEDDDLAILRLVAQGRTTDQVARRTGLSPRTVRRRLRALADRLGVDSSIEVVVEAVRAGHI
jgi:DNA-binding NarL/FixJ family response regulator